MGGASFNGTSNGNGIIDPQNYLDQTLPSSCPISKAIFWVDACPPGYTGGPIPAAVAGNVCLAIDPGGAYCAAGWPQAQTFEPIIINNVVAAELFAGGSRKTVQDHVPPLAYNPGSGDLIILAPEVGTPAVPSVLQGTFLVLHFALDAPLSALPSAAYLFQAPLDTPSWNNVPISIANIVPGPSVAATQVRFRVNNLASNLKYCHWNHLSVGLQSGSSSSTIAAPVPVMVARGAEYARQPDTSMWTDWTDLAMPAGQNLLFKASLFNPGLTNSWSFKASGAPGAWVSDTDSWNSTTMLGTVTWQPGRTHMIDRAQYR